MTSSRGGWWVVGLGLTLVLSGCPEESAGPGDASGMGSFPNSTGDDDRDGGGDRGGSATDGGGGWEGGQQDGEAAARARASIEQLFTRLQEARAQGDDQAYFGLLTPQTQEERLVKVLFACSKNADNEMRRSELDRILGIYGADLQETQAEKRIDPVTDRAGLYAELMEFLRKIARVNRYDYVSLAGLTVEGERAKATLTLRDESGNQSERPVAFRRVAGTWRLHL